MLTGNTGCWSPSADYNGNNKRRIVIKMLRSRVRDLLRQVPRLFQVSSCAPRPAQVQPLVSTARMLSRQSELARLPVPALSQTLDKYLLTVKPLLTDEEYRQTEKVVKDFAAPGGVGDKLQTLLVKRAKNTENWLSQWWLNSAYLDYRWPVVVYSSPGMVAPLQTFVKKDDQIRCAAKLISGALDFKYLLDKRLLPADMMSGAPLDMSQYLRILSTCRIPGEKRDSLVLHGDGPNPSKHIIVAHKNHFFSLKVYGKGDRLLSESQIYDQLKSIVEQSKNLTHPVGILTSEHRDIWAKVYSKLRKNTQNRQSLDEIERGIFVLCLDGDSPNKPATGGRQSAAAYQMTHGAGSAVNSGNRWFDKTLQFVVGTDGEIGLTYEHTPSEGPPVANCLDHVVDYMGRSNIPAQLAEDVIAPKHLPFELSNDILADIELAKAHLDSLVKDLDMLCFVFRGYGKDFIKKQKLSPDSFIQMAIQLAFYRIHGEAGACYESASTRRYIHGRTETIRSTSLEAVDMCQTFLDHESGDKEKAGALRRAIESHKNYVNDAVRGFGVDRHLLGLKLTAIENGLDIPQLHLDTGFTRSSHFRISTSQVPVKCEAFMCYGPLVPDGYGCCYNPRDREIIFGLSSYNSCTETSAQKFLGALDKSLSEMHDVLVKTTQQAKL